MKLSALVMPSVAVCLILLTNRTPLSAQEGGFDVRIAAPADGSSVAGEVTISGTAKLPQGHHLWLLVRRYDFEPLWWPQREAVVNPRTGEWKGSVTLGQPRDVGWDFDVAAVAVAEEGHNRLMAYWRTAMSTGDWRPIEIPDTTLPPRVLKIKKTKP